MVGGQLSSFYPSWKESWYYCVFSLENPCDFMRWVGTERKGCSDESVFQQSVIIVCYIWVWSIDTDHGSGPGVPKGGTLGNKVA